MDYIPDLTQLPNFVLRLTTDVEWNVEKDCFDTLCRVMARFYRKPNNPEVSFAWLVTDSRLKLCCKPRLFFFSLYLPNPSHRLLGAQRWFGQRLEVDGGTRLVPFRKGLITSPKILDYRRYYLADS